MYVTPTVAAIAALISVVSAGTLYVDNHCSFDMYLVSSSTPATTNQLVHLTPNTTNAYHEVMRNATYGLNALTVSRTPDLASPIQATYSETTEGETPGLNFYALSTIYGDPVRDQGFQLLAALGSYSIDCPPRSPDAGDCPFTYSPSNPNGDHAVFDQNDLADLVLALCNY